MFTLPRAQETVLEGAGQPTSCSCLPGSPACLPQELTGLQRACDLYPPPQVSSLWLGHWKLLVSHSVCFSKCFPSFFAFRFIQDFSGKTWTKISSCGFELELPEEAPSRPLPAVDLAMGRSKGLTFRKISGSSPCLGCQGSLWASPGLHHPC